MCITLQPAKLNNTKILALRIAQDRYFLAYSNKVKNLSGKPNAMILPIPGKTKPEWFYNTAGYSSFLTEIVKATTVQYRSMSLGRVSKGVSFEQFECGMYNVGLAVGFDGADAFINSLPKDKQPEVPQELRDFFKAKYAKDWSFAVCVFDSDKTTDAQPIAFEFEPAEFEAWPKEALFFPTMDSHDGKAPTADPVDTDHVFLFEDKNSTHDKITLQARVPDFLQNRRWQQKTSTGMKPNGDTYIPSVRYGELQRKF